MKTRDEMLKDYLDQFEEGSFDIIVNPDGSTVKIPAEKDEGGKHNQCLKS